MSANTFSWWGNLLHGGMLLDLPRLNQVLTPLVGPLPSFQVDRLRRELAAFGNNPTKTRSDFVAFVLEKICTFHPPLGTWNRGSKIDSSWTRRGLGNEAIRPAHLWTGPHSSTVPVFLDDNKRLGLGRGKRVHSHALQWLRATSQSLAVLTNGHQWRLVFAGLDFDAFVEWDVSQWFSEGEPAPELAGFRSLLAPQLWHAPQPGAPAPLLAAIRESRKGQADLSQVLGERVRQAAEHLIQAHSAALTGQNQLPPADIYRAAVRMIMRLVVVLFAESREGLLPRDNTIYYGTYSLHGLRELLDRISPHRLADAYAAWPRVIALLRLIHSGSHHEAMPVPAYGGELFAPGRADSPDPMSRALHLFETACLNQSLMSDLAVRQTLHLLTRTRVKIRQGRSATWMTAPVDFSALDSEYIGILYEGLLDFELRCAGENEPIVFLAVGNEPALPLSTLEQMNDGAIKNLLEKLKDTSSGDGEQEEASEDEAEESAEAEQDVEEEVEDAPTDDQAAEAEADADSHYTLQARAENWARRVCQIANLVPRQRGAMTPERQMAYDRALSAKARQLVVKVVLPGEWYLVRWGGTRKGSGTFYTRPPLAVPTVHRTLRPLAYEPPTGADGKPNTLAPAHEWKVKPPETILSLKVCDPACGSGSFPLAALRFLTAALFESMQKHGRFCQHNGRDIMDLIRDKEGKESLVNETLPCRPDDDDFERRVKAVLRRYVVERCIYGVDLDPLAVELCRLSLWIETLDRSLPLTFLNHKIKSGNSLVGTWFDQFLHYPAMAWQREGGDKNHTNGVHFQKEAWTKAIAAFAKEVKTDLIHFIDGARLFFPVDLSAVRNGHDAAEAALREIHELGIAQVEQRAEKYEALRRSPEFQKLQEAFDLWCALWFWPADQLAHAPLPAQFAEGKLSDQTRATARALAAQHRFFHWELEFPDVFNAGSQGFSAVLGNPPWDISKPNSKEFFSAFDPLYRSYGKQEAVGMQRGYFQCDQTIERQWLEHNARFKAMSNWVKFAGFAFGDRVRWKEDNKTRAKWQEHDLSLGDRGRDNLRSSQRRHDKWKQKREETSGYSANTEHPFRYQGSADVNLYKLFLEQAHALMRDGGRMGLIVPSGLYSDFGTGELRRLFLDKCEWEWLFGYINWKRVFQSVYYRFKFCIAIIAKSGRTSLVNTAFGRYDIADWENAPTFALSVTVQQIHLFSPASRIFLEVRQKGDLLLLDRIYSAGLRLGDQSERGWGIQYAREFDMTNDSTLFPPRPKWEEWGYRPDEYSRWIRGEWRPIGELWAEMNVHPLPDGQKRCAQPPYDTLPIPRADIPAGIILSRDTTHFIREAAIPMVTFTDAAGKPLAIEIENENGDKEEIEATGLAVALPLYEGRMIGRMDFSEKGWVSGRGRTAKWREIPWDGKQIEPQFLMGHCIASKGMRAGAKLAVMNIASSTNRRTVTGAPIYGQPCNHALNALKVRKDADLGAVAALLNSLVFDAQVRARLAGLNLSFFVLDETTIIPPAEASEALYRFGRQLAIPAKEFAALWLSDETRMAAKALRKTWAMTAHERLRVECMLQAMIAAGFNLSAHEVQILIRDCDYPRDNLTALAYSQFDPKGFWRVDKDMFPEHRLPVLFLVAFHDLQQKIDACGGKVSKGIEAFCNENDGEGWMLPEALRLADYGLGHDDRAQHPQPVRECFGPRFYDWQLAQTPEESWRECHLHARNLLGEAGYQRLLAEITGKAAPEATPAAPAPSSIDPRTGTLFDTENAPLFQSKS